MFGWLRRRLAPRAARPADAVAAGPPDIPVWLEEEQRRGGRKKALADLAETADWLGDLQARYGDGVPLIDLGEEGARVAGAWYVRTEDGDRRLTLEIEIVVEVEEDAAEAEVWRNEAVVVAELTAELDAWRAATGRETSKTLVGRSGLSIEAARAAFERSVAPKLDAMLEDGAAWDA